MSLLLLLLPKTLEAITLYQADELSAKVNAYKSALSEVKEKGKWTKFLPLASTDLYNHGILYRRIYNICFDN